MQLAPETVEGKMRHPWLFSCRMTVVLALVATELVYVLFLSTHWLAWLVRAVLLGLVLCLVVHQRRAAAAGQQRQQQQQQAGAQAMQALRSTGRRLRMLLF